MNLCRCPHCGATFQVHIPDDHEFWDRNSGDEDGFTTWVCLDCHKQGLSNLVPSNSGEVTYFSDVNRELPE